MVHPFLDSDKAGRDSSSTHLIRMDHEDGLAVHLLHLLRGHQVSHTHGPPARLPLPEHRVHGGQQRADVAFLTLDPVQDLGRTQREGGEVRWTSRAGAAQWKSM